MLKWVLDKWQSYRLKKVGIKVNFPSRIKEELECESPSSVSNSELIGTNMLGAYSYIGRDSIVRSAGIGRFTSIGKRVTIGAVEHPVEWLSTHNFPFNNFFPKKKNAIIKKVIAPEKYSYRRTIEIGNDVWIGDGAFIKSGVTIGNGAIVAAHAVVTKNVPAFAVVAGVPAKVIRFRFDEAKIKEIEKLQWWNYDLSSMGDDIKFNNPGLAIKKINALIENGKLEVFQANRYTINSINNRIKIKKMK